MLVGDWTSNRWVTAFSDVAELLLGKTSQEIGELLEHDKEAADNIFNEISFQQKSFKLRTKVETYQDVPKNKITVLSITEPVYKDYNKHLVANIQRLTGIHKAESV
jgi:replication factor A1